MRKTLFGIALMTIFALASCGGEKADGLSSNSAFSQSSESSSKSNGTSSNKNNSKNSSSSSSDHSSSSSSSATSSSSASNSSSSSQQSSSSSSSLPDSTSSSSSIHEHTYSSYWSSDDECHWHVSTCGHDLISEKEKHIYKSDVTNPTYEAKGFTTYTCTICGHSYTASYTDKLKHSFGSTWENNSTMHWHACTDQGYEYLKSDESEHKYVDKVVNSTHEEKGYTTHTCSVCGYSYTDSYTDKLTHQYSDSWSYDAASHWHICLDEGYEHLRKDVSAHDFEKTIIDPTFDSKGYTTYKCKTCSYTYTDAESDKLNHSYSPEWNNNEKTHWHDCMDEGFESLKSGEETHTYTSKVTDPTYEAKGYTTHTCSVCGYTYKDSYMDKLVHKYSTNWLYDETYHWHGCEDEGFDDLKEGLAEHDLKETVVEPTYDSEGYTLHSCECGYSYEDNIIRPLTRTYTIIWENWDGSVLKTDVVDEGTIPEYTGETPIHETDEAYTYTFKGWSPEIGTATSDQTYVAAFTNEKIKYVISFDLNGGTSSSYEGSKTVEFFDRNVFFFDVTKENNNFRGWSYNGKKIFDETGKLYDTPEMESEMTFVALFADTVKMNLTINISEAGTISGNGEYQYNSNVDISAHPYQGYKFVGWYCQGFLLSTTENYNYVMWDKDITIEARFALDSFKMTITSNDEEYGLVLLKTAINDAYRSAYTEDLKYKNKVTISAFSRTEVRFLGWYDEDDNLVSPNAVYSFTMPNRDYSLEAKWNHFKIEYELNGGTNSEENPSSYTLEDEIILNDAMSMVSGYSFEGWYLNGEKVEKIDRGTIGNITLAARYSADLQGLTVVSSDPSKGTVEIVSGEGYTDEEITVKATPAEGCAFKGWYKDNKQVSKDEIYTFTMPANNCSLTADFWTKEELLGMTPAFDSESNTVTYGLYPQTHVSDGPLISSLNKLTTAESNGWYLYDGSYYAKKSANPYSSDYTFDDGTKIVTGTEYWFKCEPIEWNILSSNDGAYSLVTSALLDTHQYYSSTSDRTIDGKTVYPNNYEYSDIRYWLNGDFYESAFALDDSLIQTVTVDNSAATTGSSTNNYACNDTEDKVYLLSYQDYENADYFSGSASRRCKVTDWAKANYAWCSTGSSYYGNGYYWTRSPYSGYSGYAWCVDGDGVLSYSNVRSAVDCVRPAITIKVA